MGGSVLGFSAVPESAAAEPTEVGESTSLSEPGEYVLVDDLDVEGDCFRLSSSDIILDGNGHTISGDGTGTGVIGGENPVVRDLTIENFGTGCYITGMETGEMTLENTVVSNTSVGIAGDLQVSVEITNSVLKGNNIGIGYSEAFGITITESILSGNGLAVYTNEEGNNMEVKDSAIVENGNGITAGIGTFVNNTIADNRGYGLQLGGLVADTSLGPITITGNEIRNNTGPGIRFTSAVGSVRENTITNNQSGIVMTGEFFSDSGSSEYLITRNNIENNRELGILDNSSAELDRDITTLAKCNYWGDPTGPVHPENPLEDPNGDGIYGDVEFVPWSVEPIRDGEAACIGGDPIGDFQRPPTDPDGDGRYEDINGDREADIVDVQALFSNSGDEAIQNNPDVFDFNGDGSVNVVDVQKLFNGVLK
jgi:parallel beta-helix repeat protein